MAAQCVFPDSLCQAGKCEQQFPVRRTRPWKASQISVPAAFPAPAGRRNARPVRRPATRCAGCGPKAEVVQASLPTSPTTRKYTCPFLLDALPYCTVIGAESGVLHFFANQECSSAYKLLALGFTQLQGGFS